MFTGSDFSDSVSARQRRDGEQQGKGKEEGSDQVGAVGDRKEASPLTNRIAAAFAALKLALEHRLTKHGDPRSDEGDDTATDLNDRGGSRTSEMEKKSDRHEKDPDDEAGDSGD